MGKLTVRISYRLFFLSLFVSCNQNNFIAYCSMEGPTVGCSNYDKIFFVGKFGTEWYRSSFLTEGILLQSLVRQACDGVMQLIHWKQETG